MWVSEKRWAQLCDRVMDLEAKQGNLEAKQGCLATRLELLAHIEVAGPQYVVDRYARIHLHDLIRDVLSRLGLELKYRLGMAAGVDVVAKPQAKVDPSDR